MVVRRIPLAACAEAIAAAGDAAATSCSVEAATVVGNCWKGELTLIGACAQATVLESADGAALAADG